MAKVTSDLLSVSSRVEVPFVYVEMAGFTFGVYSQEKGQRNEKFDYNYVKVNYPNFINSLKITKNANGLINQYTLNIIYAVTPQDDPNFFEKVISKAKKDRKIIFNYGDYSAPNFIYRNEEALITNVQPSLNIDSHTISYTIEATSSSYKQSGAKYSFIKRVAKPSDVIKEILFNTQYRLTDIFYGMRNLQEVNNIGFIANDDAYVEIEAKDNITVLDYLKYLVNCMRWNREDANSVIKKSVYKIAVYDDITSDYGGPYFKVVRYYSNTEVIDSDDLDFVNIDIGYPTQSNVIDFKVNNNESYSLLIDYNNELRQNQYIYRIDDNGVIDYKYTDKVVQDGTTFNVTEEDKTWWAKVTSYPISAKLYIRGLLRPVILMSYIKVNVLFYGNKYIYSGIYIINGQEDIVDGSGYRTTLTLIRVGGIEL